MPLWVRPDLFPPDHTVSTLSSFDSVDVPIDSGSFTVIPGAWGSQPEAWVLSNETVDMAGKPASAVPADCMQALQTGKASHPALLDCLTSHGIRIAVTYQPASRYWAFQWTETAIYVALALVLAGICFWWIRRSFA
jgi:hypothetical protein